MVTPNKLQKWLLGAHAEGYTDQHRILRDILMPSNSNQQQRELLLYLYTQILSTTPEGASLLRKKDMYNSYKDLDTPEELCTGIDLQQIATNIENQRLIDLNNTTTFIDCIYEALIYILEEVL